MTGIASDWCCWAYLYLCLQMDDVYLYSVTWEGTPKEKSWAYHHLCQQKDDVKLCCCVLLLQGTQMRRAKPICMCVRRWVDVYLCKCDGRIPQGEELGLPQPVSTDR